MPQFSNYAESGILNFLFRANTNTFAAPSNVSIALCSNLPSETQGGNNIPELANAGSYARVNLGAPSNADWSEVSQVAESGNITNSADAVFGPATADWGMASAIAIVDNATYGAGNLLMYGYLTTPRDIRSGDTFTISAGNLAIYLG